MIGLQILAPGVGTTLEAYAMGPARYGYAVEKLTTTIRYLATGPGDARQRLARAFLIFHTLGEEDFPPEARARWNWVKQQLTKFGPLMHPDGTVWRGSVEHTMSRIRKKTGAKIAEAIYDLYWEVSGNREYF